jgi:PAS domain S-box-containing protein
MDQGNPKGQILVVEDENIVALDIRQSLNRLGYSVPTVAATGEEAILAAQKYQPDLILMDIRLRGRMDGIEAATQIRRTQRLPVIYLTAFADTKTLDRAKMTEPFGYILKPFEDRELNSTIEMALYRHKMDKRMEENERWLDTILRSIGDAVIATDSVGRISFMNPVAEALTDNRTERVQGLFFDHVMQIYAKSGGRMQPVNVVQPQSDVKSVRTCDDGSLLLSSGATISIDCTIAPLMDEGRLVGSVVVLRDISRRKSAENALRASEQRYRNLFEQAQTALLTSELHNQIN